MERVVERLQQQFAAVRSGRASAGMLDHILVRACERRSATALPRWSRHLHVQPRRCCHISVCRVCGLDLMGE